MDIGGVTIDTAVTALHEAAATATGLSDFGDGYLNGLTRLVGEFASRAEDELALSGRASAMGFAFLTERLKGRLISEEAWRQRPEVLEHPVPPPIVITGLPRTGTTALHKLLAMDERFQVLESWIMHCPMPRPAREHWGEVPCYQAAVERFEQRPVEERKPHWVEPHEGDECLQIMGQSFVSNLFGSAFLLPDYDEWFLQADMRPSFSRYADQLRLIGASDERRWLLKNPSHIFSLDELFAIFPDACVVQTHRPVLEAMSSQLSLLSIVAATDRQRRAERELRMWGEGVRRAEAARVGREERFFDVDYRDLVRDWSSVIEAVYSRLGLELDDRTQARMMRWVAENPKDSHGKHVYDPATMGVTAELVEEHFGDYICVHRLGNEWDVPEGSLGEV